MPSDPAHSRSARPGPAQAGRKSLSDVFVRRARPDEAPILSDIAFRAKASHGYPREWLSEWKDDLTLTPAFIEANPVFVAEVPGADCAQGEGEAPVQDDGSGHDAAPGTALGQTVGDIVGIIALEDGAVGPEIAHMWVLPEVQGRGVGRWLLRRAIQEARSRGWHGLQILSDPNAVKFYEKIGAVRTGTQPAPVAGNHRELPVLKLSFETS